jgi:hypothetical protein
MAVLAAIGLGVQALSGIGSFIQAGQRQKEIDKANRAAQKAVAEAKKQIQVKPYEALTVSDTPYERQREQFASQAAQATQAAAEMGAAGMGRVGAIAMAGDEAQAKVRDQQIKQLETIENLKAKDEARVANELANLSLQEAEGAQLAARDAQTAKTAAITSGMGSLASVGQQMGAVNPYTGEAMFGLYGNTKGADAGAAAGGSRTLSASQQPRNIMIGDQGLNTSSVVSQQGVVVDPSVLGYNQYSMGNLFGGG